MIQKPMVVRSREVWVTRRKIVDGLTPCLLNFGLRKEKMGLDEGWDWLPVIEDGSGWEAAAGRGSLSAGWRAGTDAWWAVMSDSGCGLGGSGRLRLSLYPISPRLVGNGSAWGRGAADDG
jgi:hypothetical protein